MRGWQLKITAKEGNFIMAGLKGKIMVDRNKKQETRNKKQETRNKKQETRNKKQETRNKKQEKSRAFPSFPVLASLKPI